ncbi:MAG: class I SAM-dependent methyltransferase, partial [Actinomycetota bacterium]|nr:class I SAM-dependent methyltransferase [Actinomycetota bacterium]
MTGSPANLHDYLDPSCLAARQSIYRWQAPPLDLPGEVAALLAEVDGVVADVGYGNGPCAERLRGDRRVITVDLSAETSPEVVADAQRLPLRTGSVHAVLAMHMLYHVPGIALGADELRGVLRAGGVLYAFT